MYGVNIRSTVSGLTRVFSTTTPLNKADNEEDQYDESDGTHQANEPALSGYVYLVYVGCGQGTHRHTVWDRREWKYCQY